MPILSTNRGPFSDNFLLEIGQKIGKEVHNVGAKLNVEFFNISNIQQSNPRNAGIWGYEVLQKWQARLDDGVSQGEALERLMKALTDAGRFDLAEEAGQLIEKERCDDMEQGEPCNQDEAVDIYRNIQSNAQALLVQVQNQKKQLNQKDKEISKLMEKINSKNNGNNASDIEMVEVDKLSEETKRKLSAYGCACDKEDCLRCQLLPVAEAFVASEHTCPRVKAIWQSWIDNIRGDLLSTEEWKCKWSCSYCSTVECDHQQSSIWAGMASLLEAHNGHGQDGTLQREAVAVFQAGMATGEMCERQVSAWQEVINVYTSDRQVLQELVTHWSHGCGSIQCASQYCQMRSKLCRTILAIK